MKLFHAQQPCNFPKTFSRKFKNIPLVSQLPWTCRKQMQTFIAVFLSQYPTCCAVALTQHWHYHSLSKAVTLSKCTIKNWKVKFTFYFSCLNDFQVKWNCCGFVVREEKIVNLLQEGNLADRIFDALKIFYRENICEVKLYANIVNRKLGPNA